MLEESKSKAPIVASWKRSKEFGVDPVQVENDILTGGELKDRQGRLHDFFRTSNSLLERLYAHLKKTSFMLIVSDPDGYIVRSWADSPFIHRARKVWLDAGANWHERVKGTNAIGVALAEKSPVSVVGKEHYCRENHFLTCYASPIYSPTGELLGILDVSGDARNHQSHTLGMVIAATQACQTQMLLENARNELILCLQETDTIVQTVGQPLISVDENGLITRINQEAASLLKRPISECIGQPLSHWFQSNTNDLLSSRGSSTKKIRLVSDNDGKATTWVVKAIHDGRRKVYRAILRPEEPRKKFEGGKSVSSNSEMVFQCPKIQNVLKTAAAIARTDATVLIQGETGTGKEWVAQYIHEASGRRGPLVVVNCAAIPEQLIESEMFGYEKGSFTGARSEGHIGKFEAANGGTLFLDEIGELPLGVQAVLLRVLEEKKVIRIGSHQPKPVDIRIVAATNRVLAQEVKEGRFRSDLYYRLCEFELFLPPLRERSDLFQLVRHFLQKNARDVGVEQFVLDDDSWKKIQRYHWPGNIRELRQILRQAAYRAYFVRRSTIIKTQDLAFPQEKEIEVNRRHNSIYVQEEDAIVQAIQNAKGNLSEASRLLGISRTTLYRKMEQYPRLREIRESSKQGVH